MKSQTLLSLLILYIFSASFIFNASTQTESTELSNVAIRLQDRFITITETVTIMSCTLAVSNSPVFSPSSSLFEPLALPLAHVKFSPSSALSPTPSSPCSPFRFRIQKPLTRTTSSAAVAAEASPQTILKRKRPAKLHIPVAALSFGGSVTPREGKRDEVEEEREGCYSVYCKRGRREFMEDRYSAVLDFQGDSKQVL